MTTSTDLVEAIFQDARELQADALEMLSMGKIRNAAEKAWGATKRATDALILSRTGEENRSGLRRRDMGSGYWRPRMKRSGERTWSGVTTLAPGRARGQ